MGRPLYAAIVGERANKHAVLLQGGIHGREHMTTTLVMMQLERLLRVGEVRDITFYLLPMTNPDGVMISLQQKGTQATDEMYWMDAKSGHTKSARQEYYRMWKANAAGVDLNRNFDAMWERIDTAPMPSSDGYRGERPFSEPETMALKKYTEKRCFDATISYHATGSEIFYAFQNNEKTNQDGLSLAKAVNRRLRYEILPDAGTSFGGYKDWAIMKRGIPSLTIEIGKNLTPLSIKEWPDIWRRNRNLPQAIAKWVRRQKGVWF
jgi:g-D-glutamyl-meso-diaminopimelate peptidase